MYKDAVNVFLHLAGYVTSWRMMRLEGWLPVIGKACLCCDGILHISLNEIVTWRVVSESVHWWSLHIASKLT